MSRLEDLPPDLGAVLSLLLRQRTGYVEISGMLGIPERAVRDRAHAALALLAPRQARELTAPQREEIGEYLLGRQTPARALATRALLERSAPARGWALALADELAPLAVEPLPSIPEGPDEPEGSRPPSSRTGGAIVLGAIAAVAIAGVVLIVGILGGGGGGGSHGATTSSAHTTSASSSSPHTSGTHPHSSTGSSSSTSSQGSAPHIGKPQQLTPPEPGASKAVGVAYVLTKGSTHAFYLIAQGLAPTTGGTFYAVWLENAAGESVALGSLPALSSGGHTEGGGTLPSNAANFDRMAVTLETDRHPTHPGRTALTGAFTLG